MLRHTARLLVLLVSLLLPLGWALPQSAPAVVALSEIGFPPSMHRRSHFDEPVPRYDSLAPGEPLIQDKPRCFGPRIVNNMDPAGECSIYVRENMYKPLTEESANYEPRIVKVGKGRCAFTVTWPNHSRTSTAITELSWDLIGFGAQRLVDQCVREQHQVIGQILLSVANPFLGAMIIEFRLNTGQDAQLKAINAGTDTNPGTVSAEEWAASRDARARLYFKYETPGLMEYP
jgi:hypothetical protein